MFAIFGLGLQEILLLLCCATAPVAGAAIAFVVLRMSARKVPRDDFDDESVDSN